jgi:hypothetical protein
VGSSASTKIDYILNEVSRRWHHRGLLHLISLYHLDSAICSTREISYILAFCSVPSPCCRGVRIVTGQISPIHSWSPSPSPGTGCDDIQDVGNI